MYFTKRHKALIDQLQELCPTAFPKKPLPKVPLAVVGQTRVVQAALDIDYRTAEILLHYWCQGKRYHAACVEGAKRYRVNGTVYGSVSPKQALYHKGKLDEYYAGKAVGEAKKHDAPKPKTATEVFLGFLIKPLIKLRNAMDFIFPHGKPKETEVIQ